MKKVLSLLCGFILAAEPNPPTWVENVKIFTPDGDMADYNKTIADIHSEQGGIGSNPLYDVPNQWSWKRFALLFAPGTYDLKVEVGFYT